MRLGPSGGAAVLRPALAAALATATVLLPVTPLVALAAAAAPAAGATPVPPTTLPGARPSTMAALPESRSYVLVDVGTGNVLAGYKEHLRVPPASLTKILTALVAVTYLPPNAGVRGTVQSWNAYPNTVGIQKGVPWPLEDVLQALLVYSANDAAYAIAQRVSGSLAAFGPVMDGAARQIGMSDNPVFHDPAGLDGTEGVGGGNMVSARDLAIAGRDLLRTPQLAKIVRERSYDFVDPTGAPHDLPSMDYVFLESYPGAIGIKTGFTDRAGSCIVAAATRKGRTMLAVVMDGYNPTQSAIDLLNQGFATPVAAERATDRLPPVALPRPEASPPAAGRPGHSVIKSARGPGRAAAGPSGRASGRAGAGRSHGPTAGRPMSTASKTVRRDRGGAAKAGGRHGLAAVVGSWPAQTLLLLAGVAALLALWELANANRISRRRRRALEYTNGASVIANFSGTKKRREQLIDSYRRHERPAGAERASSSGRR